jgi:outer membrane protein assembly factor BamB
MHSFYNIFKSIFFTFIIILLSASILDAQIPANGLAVYYPFSGDANDGSGNGNNAIYTNATLTADRFGNSSSAYSFNGINDYIDLGDILDNIFCADTAQFTISGWAQTRNYNPIEGNLIIGKSAGGPGPYQWSVSHNSGTLFGAVFSDNAAQNYQQKYVSIGTNQWYHFVLIFDGKQQSDNRIQIYVNGTLNMYNGSSAGTLSTSTENTSLHLYIGGQNYFSSPQSLYDGLIDDIRIYNRPLTQAEINELYHEGGWGITVNHSPVANAGSDQNIYTDSSSGVSVNLDASLSFDSDDDILTYTWKESGIPFTTGINPSVLLSFGVHNITLFVDDGRGGLDSAMVTVTIGHSSEGLAAYYPFKGNANDESGNGYNAIYINATPTFDRFGKDSSAFYFNGIDNYMDFGDILDSVFCKDTAQFSISGWAKTKVMGNVHGEGNLVIGKTAGGIGPYQWSVSHNSGMVFGGVFSDSTVNNFQHKYISMGENEWYHFVLLFDGKQSVENRMRIIVNNYSDMKYWSGAGTLGSSTQNTSLHMYIGGQTHYFNALQSRYNGIIDDIRIYNRVLSSNEIQTLYLEGGWDTTNHSPIANAGSDQTVSMDGPSGASVMLDGSASYDSDGDALTYTWKEANTTIATGVNPNVQLPLGSHTISLFVADGRGGIDEAQVVVTIYSQLMVKVVFSLNVGGPIYAGISVLGDNAIYAIASGDAVYRMNATGNVAYTIQVAGDIRSSSSIAYDTTMYIASSDRNLYAFSKDGNSLWPPLPTGGVLTATPTIDSAANCLYIGVSNHNFIAVNRLTGAVVWNYFADDQIWNSAVVTSDRKLIFATQSGTLYGFDLNKLTLPATPSWRITLPDAAPSSIALDKQGYIYIGTGSGRLLKISMLANQQPSILWQVQLGGAIVGSPVIDASGTLYVGSSDANLYAVNIQSGTVKWTFSTNGAIRSTPAISDIGNIYIANESGEVIALDTNKNVLWYYMTSSAIEAPLMYYKSTLYIGTIGNQVIALYDVFDSLQTPLLKSGASFKTTRKPVWATFQGNNQRTGTFSSSEITGINNSNDRLPTSYTLRQNYPNPFNPCTTIRYELPVASRILIKVYNVIGQEVMVLKNGFEQAGYHEVIFENSSLPSGIYFYQMKAGSFFETKKMILMK